MTPIPPHTAHKPPISPESRGNMTGGVLKTKKSKEDAKKKKIFIDCVNKLYPDFPNGAEKTFIATCLKQLGENYIKNNFILNALRDKDFETVTPDPIDKYNELLNNHIDRDCKNIPEREEFLDPKNSIKIFITSKKCYANIPIGLLTKAQCRKILKTLNPQTEPSQMEKDMKIIADATAAWDAYQKSQTTNNTGTSK